MIINRTSSTTAQRSVWRKFVPNYIAQAAGTTIMEETMSAPTVLAATETVTAIKTVKRKFTAFTGTPAILALCSSKDM